MDSYITTSPIIHWLIPLTHLCRELFNTQPLQWDDAGPCSTAVFTGPFHPVRSIYFHNLFSLPSSMLLTHDTGGHLHLPPVTLTPRWLSRGLDCPALCVDGPRWKTRAVTLAKGLMSGVVYGPDRRREWCCSASQSQPACPLSPVPVTLLTGHVQTCLLSKQHLPNKLALHFLN